MKDTAGPAILEQFLRNCGTLARTAIRRCYRSGCISQLEAILRRAELALASTATQQFILSEACRSSDENHFLLVSIMEECSNEDLDVFTLLSNARGVVLELAARCSSVDRDIASQLRTLAMVLGLGQADDHEIMSRIPIA